MSRAFSVLQLDVYAVIERVLSANQGKLHVRAVAAARPNLQVLKVFKLSFGAHLADRQVISDRKAAGEKGQHSYSGSTG